MVGAPANLGALSADVLSHLTLDVLIAEANAGNRIVLDTIVEVGKYLGIAIANVINTLNPQRVVVGGSVARFGDALFDVIRTEVRRRAIWTTMAGLAIAPSTLGEEAGSIGAAALRLETLPSADFHIDPSLTDLRLHYPPSPVRAD